MSLEGLWTEELYGLFGWENRGVLVLEGGRVMGGGNNHFAVGSYRQDGDRVQMTLDVQYHGTPRTEFGSADRRFTAEVAGTLDGERIEGEVTRSDRAELALAVRFTRRAELP